MVSSMNIFGFIVGTIYNIFHFLYVDFKYCWIARIVSILLFNMWFFSRIWVWRISYRETLEKVKNTNRKLLNAYEGRRFFDKISLNNVKIMIRRRTKLFFIPLFIIITLVIILLVFTGINGIVGSRFTAGIVDFLESFFRRVGPTLALVAVGSILFILANNATFLLSPVVFNAVMYVGLHFVYKIPWENLKVFAVITLLSLIPLTVVGLTRVGLLIARFTLWSTYASKYRFDHYSLLLLRHRTVNQRYL